MAFTYGFYNSVAGDRKYNAEQMSEIFDGILRDGVIPSIGQIFAVTTANNGMQINIGSGRAWFNHTWSKNDSVMVLTVPRSDITRPRYDAVVLEVNHSRNVRANSIKIISGDPLVNPTKPALVNTDLIHQYPLAYILVRAATDKINASDIENMVGRSPTVFATGVLESVSIDHLWDQWKGEFNEWFDEIKLILSDDVVTNLQYQIDQLNAKVPAKATSSEAIAGTNNTKYVTPYTAKALIDAEKDTIKDQNGVEYGVKATNIVPVKAYAYTFRMAFSNVNFKNFILKNYIIDIEAIRISDPVDYTKIMIHAFNKSSYASFNKTLQNPSGLDPSYSQILAIENTNSFFLFDGKDTVQKITVSDNNVASVQILSGLTVDTENVKCEFFYINETYSVFILNTRGRAMTVYRLSNKTNSTPTKTTWTRNYFYSTHGSDAHSGLFCDNENIISYSSQGSSGNLVQLYIERYNVLNFTASDSGRLSTSINKSTYTVQDIAPYYDRARDKVFFSITVTYIPSSSSTTYSTLFICGLNSTSLSTIDYSDRCSRRGIRAIIDRSGSWVDTVAGVVCDRTSGKDYPDSFGTPTETWHRFSYLSKQYSKLDMYSPAFDGSNYGVGGGDVLFHGGMHGIFRWRHIGGTGSFTTSIIEYINYDGSKILYLDTPPDASSAISTNGGTYILQLDDHTIMAGNPTSFIYDLRARKVIFI